MCPAPPPGPKPRTPRRPHIDIAENVLGESYLRIVASNGQLLAHSETYATRSKARRAAHTLLDTMAILADAGPDAIRDGDAQEPREVVGTLTLNQDGSADIEGVER